MALQQRREDRPNGNYSICVWDDDFGHATIWEYDSNDQLQRRATVTHLHDGAPGGSAGMTATWHDASGHEIAPPDRPARRKD